LASVYVGTAADASFGDAIARETASAFVNLAGRTSLPEALVVLQHAAVTIAVDSGPMHLAAAVGSPVVALFGSGNPEESRPWAANAQVVGVDAPCGCLHPRCDYTDGPGRCMRAIAPGVVIDAIRSVIAR
jgi:ADP-heptose:LPS heptosyltransferase